MLTRRHVAAAWGLGLALLCGRAAAATVRRPDFSTPVAAAPRQPPCEFVVAGEAPTATDENPGSAERPFKTLGRGFRDLRPGDTLTVCAGTYREAIEVELIGTETQPILVRAAPGATVVIKGSAVVREWTRAGSNTWVHEGWTKERVTRDYANGTHLVSANVMAVFQRDGVRDDAVVLWRVRRAEDLREGTCFWDAATGRITVWPVDPEGTYDPTLAGVEVPVRGRGLSLGGRYARVQGFQFRQFGMAAVTNWSSVAVSGCRTAIEDCVVTWADFIGLSLSGFGTALRRCEASYCGNSGLGGGVGEEMLIEGCVVTHNNLWRYAPGWHAGGAKLIPWFNRSSVRRSEFAFNYGPGLWFDGSCNDSTIEGNLCHDNEGPGIMVEISCNTLVSNNICYNNRNSLPGTDLDPIGGKGYAPTACEARRVEGGSGGNGIFISSSPGTRAYHNLCYRNEAAGIFAEWGNRESSDVVDYVERKGTPVVLSTHDVDVRNNLLINNLSCQLSLRRNGIDKDTYNNRADYNLLFSGGAVPLVRWGFGGTAFTRIEAWREASGCDQHGLAAAPLFEFSPGLDFRLKPDSPGVDQGECLAEVARDRAGRPRPLGKGADIGPYEIIGTRVALERPVIPDRLTYTAVDLSRLVNRAFADDQADDGVGGWSDQGPTTDLRTFPSGRQVFNGVPFTLLAPVGCLVLKSGFRPQSLALPERVVIPVQRRADVIVFLHSGAWLGGREHWTYTIRRGDGTAEVIHVVGGENIRDWSDPNAALPLDREYPTWTQVAWTGSNPTFERVSVYMMTYVNKHDWCNVTEIEMAAVEGGGVPILMAISTGLRQKE